MSKFMDMRNDIISSVDSDLTEEALDFVLRGIKNDSVRARISEIIGNAIDLQENPLKCHVCGLPLTAIDEVGNDECISPLYHLECAAAGPTKVTDDDLEAIDSLKHRLAYWK